MRDAILNDSHMHGGGIDLGEKVSDTTLLRLPHPKRIAIAGVSKEMRDEMVKRGIDVQGTFGSDTKTLGSMAVAFYDLLGGDFFRMANLPGSTNYGALKIEAACQRFVAQKGSIFEFIPALDARLMETDVGSDAPCSVMRSPFPAVFIDFGISRSTPLRINNVQSGEHIVEGAYIFESSWVVPQDYEIPQYLRSMGVIHGSRYRVIDVVICGSPLGKRGLLDDATVNFELLIGVHDETRPVVEVLERHFRFFELEAAEFSILKTFNAKEREQITRVVEHIVKCLLYLSCENRVVREQKDETELKARLGLVGSKKFAKLERRLNRVYDRVVVGPEEIARYSAPRDGGRSVATHWRRAHFRRVRHGVGLAETKINWIEAVLVNSELIGVDPKDYIVR